MLIDSEKEPTRQRDVDLLRATIKSRHVNVDCCPDPVSVVGIFAVGSNRQWNWNLKPSFYESFKVQFNGFLHRIKSFVEVIACRKASRQIGNGDSKSDAVVRVENNGKTHDWLLFPAGLSFNTIQRPGGDVAVRMLHSNQTRFGWVFELMMRALHSRQHPTIRFEFLNELPAVHGGYDNHFGREVQDSEFS